MSKFNIGTFPSTRLRRLRMKEFSRRMVSENNLSVDDLIWPLFVCEGSNVAEKINSMPGVFRYSIDNILKELETAVKLKIPAIALFPQIDSSLKDESGSQAIDENNLICRAIKSIKKNFPDLGVICDVALDPFTSHGHDGLIKSGYVCIKNRLFVSTGPPFLIFTLSFGKSGIISSILTRVSLLRINPVVPFLLCSAIKIIVLT